MTRRSVGGVVGFLRRQARLRQEDLAARAGTSRSLVSRVERDRLDNVPVGALLRLVEALDATIQLRVRCHGAELDRLMDAKHAALQERVARTLAAQGWDVRVEQSFNHFGDRGRYDVLAFHAPHGALLVAEIKTEFGDLQETIGRLNVKTRLAAAVAREIGWAPHITIPALIVADSTTSRQIVRHHETIFGTLSLRGGEARAWLRRPETASAPAGILLFTSPPGAHDMRIDRSPRPLELELRTW
jgi:transcriptional regulator with XRE-family HTH domain